MMANTFDEAVDLFVDRLRVRSNSRATYRIQAADKRVQEARADMTALVEALVKALRTLEPEHVSGSLTFMGCTRCGATSDGRPLVHSEECPFAALALFEDSPAEVARGCPSTAQVPDGGR